VQLEGRAAVTGGALVPGRLYLTMEDGTLLAIGV
jgi:hypothetical protein